MSWLAKVCCFFVVMLLIFDATVTAQEWTRFRGPNGTGESETNTIPAKWTKDQYQWKVPVAGVGHSSPVLWGQRLFLLSADPESATRYLLCFDAETGHQLWVREFESSRHHLHTQSSYASCTPAVDAKHVYVAWATPARITLMALTHDGTEVWSRDLGTWFSQHGFGTSPIVADDLVILSNSQEAKDGPDVLTTTPESFVMAFDCVTGKERWRTRCETVNTSYSVPAIYQPKNGPPQIVSMSTGEGFFALDVQTGKQLWSNKVFDKRTVGSPLVKQDMIFGCTGSGGGGNYLIAVKGDGQRPSVIYKIDTQAPYVPTCVARGELLFLLADNGIASCVEMSSGKVHWRKRIGGNYSSSPVRAHDKIYCVSMDGEVIVLAAEKEFEELGRVSLGEGSRATPAIANGCMYLRTFSQLMSIGEATGK